MASPETAHSRHNDRESPRLMEVSRAFRFDGGHLRFRDGFYSTVDNCVVTDAVPRSGAVATRMTAGRLDGRKFRVPSRVSSGTPPGRHPSGTTGTFVPKTLFTRAGDNCVVTIAAPKTAQTDDDGCESPSPTAVHTTPVGKPTIVRDMHRRLRDDLQ